MSSPVSLNRYTYGFADPVNYFDPDGRWPGLISAAARGARTIGRAVGTGASAVVSGARTVGNAAVSTVQAGGRLASSAATSVSQGVRSVASTGASFASSAAATVVRVAEDVRVELADVGRVRFGRSRGRLPGRVLCG